MDVDEGLCLNIVATPEPIALDPPKRKKPKKQGKWRRQPDKRRQGLPASNDNKKKKQDELQQPLGVVKEAENSRTTKSTELVSSTDKSNAGTPNGLALKPMEPYRKSSQESSTLTGDPSAQTTQTKAKTKEKPTNKKRPRAQPDLFENSSLKLQKKTVKTPPEKEKREDQNTDEPPNQLSRKFNMENEQERADYLARYHARPKELDRRNQTVRTIPDAKTSDHLFGKTDWKSLGLSDFYIQRLTRKNLATPTIIQAKALQLQNHEHVVIHSETGSGKTLAYLLPILQRFPRHGSRNDLSLSCLILVPTRELAYQIYDTVNMLTAGTNLIPGITVGAEKRSTEKAKLRKGLPILIGTPGRIMDHVESTKNFDLHKVQTIVLDEVDRLLIDRPEVIAQLLRGASNRKSLILVSATCDQTVEAFSARVNKDWHYIRETSIVPQQLQMLQLTVHAKYRFPALMALLGTHESGDTVVFCSTCASVDYYHALFQKNSLSLLENVKSMKLHGNMDLTDRTQSMAWFRSTSKDRKVLWTTDVAARGLNLSSNNIRILQYDPPTELSDYLHRAGRTARAGNAGTCLIFTLPTESRPFAKLLEETTNNPNILLPISLNETLEATSDFFPNVSTIHKADAICLEISKHFESILSRSKDLLELAKAAFLSHIRAYAVKEKALKSVFVARSLHFGHVARSFMLKDPPSSLSATKTQKMKKTKKNVVTTQHKNSQLLYSNASKLEGLESL